MFKSIRTRLTVAFVGLAIIPLLIVGGVLGIRGYNTQEEQAIASQEELGQRVAAEIEAIINNLEVQLDILVDVNRIHDLSYEEMSRILTQTRLYQNAFDELTYLDKEGKVVINSSRFAGGRVGEDRSQNAEFIVPSTTRETYHGSVRVEQASGEYFMTIAVPFIDPRNNNEFSGVLVANAKIQPMLDVLTDINLGEGEDVYIVDAENRVVGHRQLALVLRDTKFTPPTENGIHDGLNGESVVLTISPIQLSNQTLTVITEKTTEVALAEATNNGLIVIGVTLGAFALAVVLGSLAVQQIVRPIVRLSNVAQKIQSGDLNQQVEISDLTEIATLGQAFNDMTSQLRATVTGLEQRVADRTRDLQLAVDMSQQIAGKLDPDHMMHEMVSRTKDAFKYYGVHVYLYDDENKLLVKKVGSSAANVNPRLTGLLAIPYDANPSLVAQAAREQKIVTVNDVQKHPGYLPDNAFPDVHSEMVVPIIHRETLMGVLDLLAEEPDRFGDSDRQVMQTIAGNLAVALSNAELYIEAQKAKETAEQANTIKSQFLANMSHELRTPLNAILNFTEFVADGVLGPVNDKQIETLQKAISSGDHLLSLINDILDLTKIEVGMMELFIEDVNFNNIIDSVLSTAKGLIKNRPEVNIVHIVEDHLPMIRGDKRRLRQVLLNLVSNAVKFTPRGEIVVTATHEEDAIHVSVKDTGVGIAVQDIDAIFDSFRQAEHGLTAGSGTGLGLPISKHFVEAHHGRMWVESELNVGSVFHFTLPLHPVEENSVSTPDSSTVK